MKIGIGIPATIPGAPGGIVVEWAKKAEELGCFSSLGTIDRVVYANHESLTTLAAAAAVTRKVRLMTTVLVAPARRTVLLAKQAATIDSLSAGRLTLGLGVGGRQDDFEATEAKFKGRGKVLEGQLALMKRVWAGEPVSEKVGPVGPAPVQKGGPEILLGGYSAAVVAPRIARWGDGFISGGSAGDAVKAIFNAVQDEWKKAGRQGKPRLVCSAYFALGARPQERGAVYLRDYYKFVGSWVDNVVNGMLAGPEKVKAAMTSFSALGADELMLWPTIAEMGQLTELARLVQK